MAALIVNWHEVIHPELTFRFQDLGIVPTPNQRVRVTDLCTYHVVGTYSYDQEIGVKNIPGHGNFAYRFTVLDGEEPQQVQN